MKRLLLTILTILTFPIFILIIGPIRSIRIIVRGGHAVAEFRRTHGREPDAQEWQEIADRVEREMLR